MHSSSKHLAIAFILSVLCVVTASVAGQIFFAHAAASSFSDVSDTANFAPAVENLKSQGVIDGYDDGTYRPYQRVNRAEFLKMIMLASDRDVSPTYKTLRCFTDVTGTDQWYWTYACAAKEQNLINGYPDGSFQGGRYVNLAEALKIMTRAWDIPEPVYFRAPDDWYDPLMIVADELQVFTVIDREPAHELTRAEIAMLVDKFMNRHSCAGHEVGESFPSPDGCNTCTCMENGGIACTKMACPKPQVKCTSSNSCPTGQYCTTEDGDCMSLCDDPTEMCPAVCAGFCKESKD